MMLNANYWSNRYKTNQTGWDLGQISPPLKDYFDQLEDKNLKILIPGCGRGYEGKYLWDQGFRNVFLADFSKDALNDFKETCPDFPEDQLLCIDFFKLEEQFDLIIEQTMFCAIQPVQREDYVYKVFDLLKPNGKIAGLLFNRDFESGPPFGGNVVEYKTLFSKKMEILILEEAYNSIGPRQGSEVFFIAKKRFIKAQ